MKKHLIIALGEKEVILRASIITQLLTRKYPRDTVEVICFKHHQQLANQIHGIATTHIIDCEAINHALDNSYYCDMYAFNCFVSGISALCEESWEQVVNCSNYKVAAHLASVINMRTNAPVIGQKMGRKDNRITGDYWSMLDLAQDEWHATAVINKTDLYPLIHRSTLKEEPVFFNYNEQQNSKAYQLLQKIRFANQAHCKLIGIPLFNALHHRPFNFERVVETISSLLDDITLFPVIITSKNERDQVYAKQISKEFGNSIVIIEVDDITLHSVLLNLDAVIGHDAFSMNLADLIGTSSLRICESTEQLVRFYQHTTQQMTLIAPLSTAPHIVAADLHASLKHLLGDEPAIDRISSSSSLYITKQDRFGHYQMQIAGIELANFNLHHQLMRTLVSSASTFPLDLLRSIELSGVDLPAVKAWCSEQRSNITLASRDLLGTLRSLLRTQKDRKHISEFINSLDKLFRQGESDSIAALCCNLFRARVDAIEASNFNENIQLMEKSLYQLKDDLQQAIAIIRAVEEYSIEETNSKRVNASARI